jgi:transposase-like protein
MWANPRSVSWCSANIRHRHLTAEQKRTIIATLLRENPYRSVRAIAREVGVSKNTLAAERAEQDRRG